VIFLRYSVYRLMTMLLTLLVVSVLVFIIINLPPGDYLSNQIAELRATGQAEGVAKAEFLRTEYSLDKPLWHQYLIWIGFAPGPQGFFGLLQGNFGWSFEFDQPVSEIVGDALWLTVLVNLAAVLFVYMVALPLGVIAAAKSESWVDYTAAFVGYLGLATPNFLLALMLFYYGHKYFGLPIGGKPYVDTAIAKGMSPTRMLTKYPLRMAFNPFVADIGNLLPAMISGSVLVSVVLGLQTIGPDLLTALKTQDQFLSAFILMFVALLTLIGTMVSDMLLMLLDPRIKYGARKG